MDVGHTNGWRLDEVVPAAEIVGAIVGRDARWSHCPANYRGEVADRWRYVDGDGEVGVIASVTPAVLRRLHPGPDLGRRAALHVPVRRRGHDLRGAAAEPAATDEECAWRSRGVWSRPDDRYSDLRTEATADLPRVEMFAMGG